MFPCTISWADKDKPAELERTEGRKNITEPITPEGWLAEPVQTAWDFGRGDPVTMACTKWCDTRTSRSGNGDYHKGTKSHKQDGQ